MANQAIGIRHSQKTFTDSGNPQGSVFSYVDSIRIHIDRSAIGFVFPISGSDGTNGAVRRSDPYRAIGSLFDINIFKNEWSATWSFSWPFGRNTSPTLVLAHTFPRLSTKTLSG